MKNKIAAEGARTVPPREHGGNCDIKDLSRGSKIYFPVYVKGAGLSMGDLHFSQGDGEITFCGAIEMAGWLHLKVDIIKGGMAKYGIKNPIFKPSPITPNYKDYLIFEGISVDEQGKQHYLDVHIAYRQACLNAIEYLTKFGYSPAQAYADPRHGAGARATSPAWSIFPMPAPRFGCRPTSSPSTSCRRRKGRSNTSRAASTSRCRPTSRQRRTAMSPPGDARGAAEVPPLIRSRMRESRKAAREESRCPSMITCATDAVRSPTCGRWRNASCRTPVRAAARTRRGHILSVPYLAAMSSERRLAYATNERSASSPMTLSGLKKHGGGCGCCSGLSPRSKKKAPANTERPRPKGFPASGRG